MLGVYPSPSQQQFNSLLHEYHNLKRQNETLLTDNNQLKSQKEVLLNDINEQKNIINILQQDNCFLSDKMKQLEQENYKQNEQIKEEKEKYSNLYEECEKIKKTFEIQIKNLQKELNDAKQNILKKQKQFDVLQSKLKKQIDEQIIYDEVYKTNKSLMTASEKLNKNLEKNKKMMQLYKEKIKTLHNDKNELKLQNTRLYCKMNHIEKDKGSLIEQTQNIAFKFTNLIHLMLLDEDEILIKECIYKITEINFCNKIIAKNDEYGKEYDFFNKAYEVATKDICCWEHVLNLSSVINDTIIEYTKLSIEEFKDEYNEFTMSKLD